MHGGPFFRGHSEYYCSIGTPKITFCGRKSLQNSNLSKFLIKCCIMSVIFTQNTRYTAVYTVEQYSIHSHSECICVDLARILGGDEWADPGGLVWGEG